MTQYQEKIVGKPGGLVEPGVKQYGFLKKIFKPVKKIAKKVIKSPLGKAALIGGLGSYGMGMGPLGGLKGAGFLRNIPSYFGKTGALGDIFYSGKGADRKFSLGKAGLATLLGAGLTMPFLGGDDEEEEVVDNWPGVGNLRTQAQDYYRAATPDYLNSPFMVPKEFVKSDYYAASGGLARLANGGGVAEAQAEQMLKMQYQKYRNQGGTMSYQQFKMTVLKQAQGQGPMAQGQPRMAQPQMAAEGGIMDLGGMEKDYRQEGGFVPLGKKEKADDVPARLSKNEFVFTADAVRNAGGGDIDAGAQVMDNMMKNLESGGQISEESQGAQGMYNQQQMLQSRMA
jgi:hypothetical protein